MRSWFIFIATAVVLFFFGYLTYSFMLWQHELGHANMCKYMGGEATVRYSMDLTDRAFTGGVTTCTGVRPEYQEMYYALSGAKEVNDYPMMGLLVGCFIMCAVTLVGADLLIEAKMRGE